MEMKVNNKAWVCKKFPKMKKWCGGLVILALALILIFSYTLIPIGRTNPKKGSGSGPAYDFFHPETIREVRNVTIASLVSVDGLDLLYANLSILSSQDMNFKALGVWGHMRYLLSRSDALPETAQGVKEASVAWKDLVSMIEDKASVPSHENCPFSVQRAESDSDDEVEFLCGLVDGSSISFVGVPKKSFRIELLSGDSVALLFNVSLAAEDAFILQNAWTREIGWGNDEICPPRNSTAHRPKVDGLELCNKQVVRSRSAFAFSEGIPFSATLWAGSEGFHMSVNGRHETSFAYRPKLEAWSVTKVKSSAGLKLLSVLAKDLPVSEDHDMVVDAQTLKAPALKRKRIVMLVGVFSTGNNFERRMALRRSWMQYEAVRTGDVAVRFFIGLHKSQKVNYELWREAQVYGDIQLMPFVDYYTLITYKTIAICIMGTKILPAKYIMKTDDDAFVRIDEVLSSVKAKAAAAQASSLLYGRISHDSSPHRDRESKWYVSTDEWAQSSYPPWAHGPGYVISRDIAKFVVLGHRERRLSLFKLEDVAMGIWVDEFRRSGNDVRFESEERFHNSGCESDFILAHYQTPRLLLCLWQNLLIHHNPQCCE